MEIFAKFANLVPEIIGAIERSHQMGKNHAIMHDNGAAESSKAQWLGILRRLPEVATYNMHTSAARIRFINLSLDSKCYNNTTSGQRRPLPATAHKRSANNATPASKIISVRGR
jgi:hypothetical protein